MRIELVVFDMAGTTVAEGGAVYRALRNSLATFGATVPDEALRQVKGMDKREALRLLVEQTERPEIFRPQLEVIEKNFVDHLLEFYRMDPGVGEVSGTSKVFQWLREHGIRVALNTGFSRAIAQPLIDRLGWATAGLIDASVTSDEVAQGRPAPYMIDHLRGELGITNRAWVAKIGDAPADLLEGVAAGCGLNLGVTQGSSTRTELEQLPHDALLETIADLPALFVSRGIISAQQ
jgi:phosphonatase-like hydrolase